jgi:hypothetical protein
MVREMPQAPDRLADDAEGRTVRVGTLLSETGNMGDHQPRPSLLQDVVAEPEFVELSWPEVLDDRVALRGKPQHDLNRLRMFQVEGDDALVAGVERPPWRHAPDLLAPLPHGVAGRRLDLDYVGAEIAEDAGAEGRGDEMADLDDPHAGERPVACVVRHRCRSSGRDTR